MKPGELIYWFRGVTVFVFVPSRQGTVVTVRCTQSHDEYVCEYLKKLSPHINPGRGNEPESCQQPTLQKKQQQQQQQQQEKKKKKKQQQQKKKKNGECLVGFI